MINSNGGYDYSVYLNDTPLAPVTVQQQQQPSEGQQQQHNTHHRTSAACTSITQRHQQHHNNNLLLQQPNSFNHINGMYRPSGSVNTGNGSSLSTMNGPSTSLYDPTQPSNDSDRQQQNQLYLAFLNANFGNPNDTHIQQQQQHHDARTSVMAQQVKHQYQQQHQRQNQELNIRLQQANTYIANSNTNTINGYSTSTCIATSTIPTTTTTPTQLVVAASHHQRNGSNISPIPFNMNHNTTTNNFSAVNHQQQQTIQRQSNNQYSFLNTNDDTMLPQHQLFDALFSATNPLSSSSSTGATRSSSTTCTNSDSQMQLLGDMFVNDIVTSSSTTTIFEPWMDEIQLEVSSISLTPISGYEVLTRIEEKLHDVVNKFIPCVDFLVQCQQELRKGMDYITATQKRYDTHKGRNRQRDTMNHAKQYYATYIAPLTQNFINKNKHRMDDRNALNDAIQGLVSLQNDAKQVERQGCEAIKSAFLGGMKDGESWGLRRWLSKHGNALKICTDLECILSACQKLDRSLDTTKKLASQLRTKSKHVLHRLQTGIPVSYQQQSSAHPYLPFFHRLESALRGMSNFDPDDDDVICLDDDDSDDDVVEVDIVATSTSVATSITTPIVTKRRTSDRNNTYKVDIEIAENDMTNDKWSIPDDCFDNVPKRLCKDDCTKAPSLTQTTGNNNHECGMDDDNNSSSGESEIESIVEIVDIIEGCDSDMKFVTNTTNEWACASCSMINAASDNVCFACGEEFSLKGLLNFTQLEDFFDMDKSGTSSVVDDTEINTDTNNNMKPSAAICFLTRTPIWPLPLDQPEMHQASAFIIADNLDRIAAMFDQNQQSSIRSMSLPEGSFWDGERYASALRLFAQILRLPDSSYFLECVNDDRLIQAGNSPLYSHVIKHPLSLRLIAKALLGDELQWRQKDVTGFLSVQGLSKWNMWFGKDLLQAIDLVFLNSLAYGNALNQGKSQHRSSTNQLRKKLWSGISDIVELADSERRKQCMPTRRAEKSGFVVYKIGES